MARFFVVLIPMAIAGCATGVTLDAGPDEDDDVALDDDSGAASTSNGVTASTGGAPGATSGGEGGAGGAPTSAATGGTGGVDEPGGAGGLGSGSGGAGGSGGGPAPPPPPPVCGLDGCDVDDPNPATRCIGGSVVSPIVAPPGTQWASSVVAFSSEYTASSWSAAQATGAPNVYPMHGDAVNAWCPQSDAGNESITVAFSPPAVGSMVWVYETYNPNAVSTITVSTAAQDLVVYQAPAASLGTCAYVVSASTGTSDPITQVKIDLSTQAVPSWNELDAVAIVP